MQGLWVDENPAKTFLNKLRRQRAIMFMRNRAYLRQLRYNHEMAERDQKAFGRIWAEYGTDVNGLIADAHGEDWEMPLQEESKEEVRARHKKEAAVNQRTAYNDNLVATREKSSRGGLDELQGQLKASVSVLEEEQGGGRSKSPKSKGSPKETGSQEEEKEMHRLRGESFYRSAGCTD